MSGEYKRGQSLLLIDKHIKVVSTKECFVTLTK